MVQPNKAVFLIHLVQDINVLRPLVFMAARDFGFDTCLLVSTRLGPRDPSGIWQNELEEICSQSGARLRVFDDDFEARSQLTGSGLLFSASESQLREHSVAHNVFRHAPAGFLKVTVQHGFECVGFRHSSDQVGAHGAMASFGADIVCAWHGLDHLHSLAPSQRAKLVVTGPTSVLQTRSGPRAASVAPAGLVCENLHSVRFTKLPKPKAEFIGALSEFARSKARGKSRLVLRSHAGGQFAQRNNLRLPAKVEISNAPLYRVDLRGFAYAISAPSSIIIDMLLADVPTAVWRDDAGQMDVSSYAGLTTVSSAPEWLDFARAAERDPEPFLGLQRSFLAKQQMPVAPQEVFSRFAEIFRAGRRMEVRPAGSLAERERLLFVANGNSPTLQLSFEKPLAPLVGRGEVATCLLTEPELRETNASSTADRPAVEAYLDRCNPSAIVFCRYSGPAYQPIVGWAQREKVPIVYHIDDDLLGIPAAIGERKFAMHNAPERLQAVAHLLNSADLVYASTETLKGQLLRRIPGLPIISGDIYCASNVLRRPRQGKTCKLGYMASADHAHNLAMVLPAIEKLLDLNPSVQFELFGSIPVPEGLLRFGDRISSSDRISNYSEFLRAFANREWDVGICPLVPIDFNLAKANTKWVEYTAAGVATVASRATAYDDCCSEGCGILADSMEEWFSALDLLVNNVHERFAIVDRAQAKLEKDYNLTRLRSQVLNVLARAHDAVRVRSSIAATQEEQLICQTQS